MKVSVKPAILVLWAGRHRRDDWSLLCDRYLGRIRHHLPLEETPIRAGRGPAEARLNAEGQAILAALPKKSYLVALDSRGKQRTSPDLAGWLRRRLESARRPLAFAVGSDLGLGANVLEAADERLSFGKMTLPHELARVVLYEQLYRGLSILGGMKYHRGPL